MTLLNPNNKPNAMSKPITARIDVTKILKNHLFPGKNGAKYLNVAIFPNKDGVGTYGDSHYVVQDIPKEARDAGERGPIIGNLKMPEGGDSSPRQSSPPQSRRPSDRNFSRPDVSAGKNPDKDEFSW